MSTVTDVLLHKAHRLLDAIERDGDSSTAAEIALLDEALVEIGAAELEEQEAAEAKRQRRQPMTTTTRKSLTPQPVDVAPLTAAEMRVLRAYDAGRATRRK